MQAPLDLAASCLSVPLSLLPGPIGAPVLLNPPQGHGNLYSSPTVPWGGCRSVAPSLLQPWHPRMLSPEPGLFDNILGLHHAILPLHTASFLAGNAPRSAMAPQSAVSGARGTGCSLLQGCDRGSRGRLRLLLGRPSERSLFVSPSSVQVPRAQSDLLALIDSATLGSR